MTRYLLDTNIVSELVKPVPADSLQEWMAAQEDDSLFIASLTVAEIQRGILELPDGRRRDQLAEWFVGPEGPQTLFAGRVLAFDEDAALVWGRLMSQGRRAGRPRSGLDMIVAAVAEANGCIVVTANERDFVGVPFMNPLRPRGQDSS